MNRRLQEQYELWTRSEIYPAEGKAEKTLHQMLEHLPDSDRLTDAANAAAVEIQQAAFVGGFRWAVALRNAAI